jgi:hypothetical protein
MSDLTPREFDLRRLANWVFIAEERVEVHREPDAGAPVVAELAAGDPVVHLGHNQERDGRLWAAVAWRGGACGYIAAGTRVELGDILKRAWLWGFPFCAALGAGVLFLRTESPLMAAVGAAWGLFLATGTFWGVAGLGAGLLVGPAAGSLAGVASGVYHGSGTLGLAFLGFMWGLVLGPLTGGLANALANAFAGGKVRWGVCRWLGGLSGAVAGVALVVVAFTMTTDPDVRYVDDTPNPSLFALVFCCAAGAAGLAGGLLAPLERAKVATMPVGDLVSPPGP